MKKGSEGFVNHVFCLLDKKSIIKPGLELDASRYGIKRGIKCPDSRDPLFGEA
jgi:hypothetical protein